MRRKVLLTAIAGLLVIGCSTTDPEKAATETGKQAVQGPKSTESSGENTSRPEENQESQEPMANIDPSVILNQDFLPVLAKNTINGFDIAIGMSLEEVIKKYGAVTKKDYYDGGQYHAFERLKGGVVYFDGKNHAYAIDLAGEHLDQRNLAMITKNLGTPASEEVSLVDGDYILYYEAGDNSVFLSAKDKDSPVDKIRIINKKMLDASVQEG